LNYTRVRADTLRCRIAAGNGSHHHERIT